MEKKNFIVRKVNRDDYYKDHLELYKQLTVINPELINKGKYDSFIEKLNDNHQIFVICEDNKIIASGTIIIEEKLIRNLAKLAHIEDIVVDNNYRKYGLGKKIIQHLVNYGLSKGCYKITLDCNDNNIKFYENCGFTKNGNQMSLYTQITSKL